MPSRAAPHSASSSNIGYELGGIMIFNMAVERLWKPKKRNEYYIRGPLRLLRLIVHPVSQAVLETEIIYESEMNLGQTC